MTHLEALQNYILPYEVGEGKLELLLAEQGLQAEDDYNIKTSFRPMIKAVIDTLWSLITLEKEKDNGSEIMYDVDAIRDLIKYYQHKIGEDDEIKPKNIDITEYW